MQTYKIKSKFIDEEVVITKHKYGNGILALNLTSLEGEPIATASVNLPEHANVLKPSQTFIKNYSENEGILESLQKAGVVGPSLFQVSNGMIVVSAVEVLI